MVWAGPGGDDGTHLLNFGEVTSLCYADRLYGHFCLGQHSPSNISEPTSCENPLLNLKICASLDQITVWELASVCGELEKQDKTLMDKLLLKPLALQGLKFDENTFG